ncbi:MAG: hypothetical protein K9M11_03890 [Candidatus Pacebacteria bacterium]|nr:hypothetical protein [Candidatus Paceibacterota bacterium]
MELPQKLIKLYRHWRFHIHDSSRPHKVEDLRKYQSNKTIKEMVEFAHDRMSIWNKKNGGATVQYTTDPIFAQYRFCNIFRELDRQTIEFHTLLNPMREDFPRWILNMFYFRMVARTETIEKVGLLSFDSQKNREFLDAFLNSPRPRFGTPYVFPISTILKSKTPTRETFIAEYLPTIIKRVSREIESWDKKSVYDGLQKIIPIFGYNLSFLWTEVLIDVAYQYPQYIDLYKRFPVGPGSLPTMKRIEAETDPTILVQNLANLNMSAYLTFDNKPIILSAENWEGIGCEFRKYTNLEAGKGRRRLFKEKN